MKDNLYVAEDGTIRSRSGRAQQQSGVSAQLHSRRSVSGRSSHRRVYVSPRVKCAFWLASLILAALIAFAGCKLFANSVAEGSDLISEIYVKVLIFTSTFIGVIIHTATQTSYSAWSFVLGLICCCAGVIVGVICAAVTPLIIAVFILGVIIACLAGD